MILSKEVEVGATGINIKYYTELGYKLLPDNKSFLVNVEDLRKGSSIRIDIKCDVCGKIYTSEYKTYLRRVLETGFCRCLDCCRKHFNRTKLSYEFVKSEFDKRGYDLLETEYKMSKIKLKYICRKHPDIVQQIRYDCIQQGQGCMLCGKESMASKNSLSRKGKNGPAWKGGITQLGDHFRNCISPWIVDSMKNCAYKCVLTGERRNWQLHHIVSFSFIVEQTFLLTNLPIKEKVLDYTEEEINILTTKCLQLHYEYGYGVCVENGLHNKFHNIYGRGKNTKEDWEEFSARYLKGDFEIRNTKF